MSSDIKEIKINWDKIGNALMFLPKLATRPLAKLEMRLGSICGEEHPYDAWKDDRGRFAFLKVPLGIASDQIYKNFPGEGRQSSVFSGEIPAFRSFGMLLGVGSGAAVGAALVIEGILSVPVALAAGLAMPFVGAIVLPYILATAGTVCGAVMSAPSVFLNIPTGIARTREARKKTLPAPAPTAQPGAQPAQPFSHTPPPLTKEQMLGMHIGQIAQEMQPLTSGEKQEAFLKLAERFPEAFNAAADAIIQKRVQASLAAAEAPVRLAEPLRMKKKADSAQLA